MKGATPPPLMKLQKTPSLDYIFILHFPPTFEAISKAFNKVDIQYNIYAIHDMTM
jgi:hypothetical protein